MAQRITKPAPLSLGMHRLESGVGSLRDVPSTQACVSPCEEDPDEDQE